MTDNSTPQPRLVIEPFEKLIPPAFQQAVGLVFLISGAVEAALSMQIGRMACSGAVFDVRLSPLLFGATTTVKLNIVRIYSKMLNLSKADDIDAALNMIGKAFDRRDDLAHGTVAFADGKLTVFRTKLTPKTGVFKEQQSFSAEDIHAVSLNMRRGANDLDVAITGSGLPPLSSMPLGVNRLPPDQ